MRVKRSQRLLATEGVRQAGGMHRRVSSPWGFGSLELVKDLPIPWEWYLKSDDKPLWTLLYPSLLTALNTGATSSMLVMPAKQKPSMPYSSVA